MTGEPLPDIENRSRNSNNNFVWYSPERDELHVAALSGGFLFKNEHGYFHAHWDYATGTVVDFYLVGEL